MCPFSLTETEIPLEAAKHPEKVNILVVDDLPEKLMVYESLLEELGQNLVTVNSGEEALKLVLKHEFAVILLDVNMPGMDGFETASLIRQRKKSAHTPIIFLTAFTDEVKAAQGYASGAVDYLPTPVVPEVLKAKVRVFIELSQMRQQAALRAEEKARRTAAEEADKRKDEFLGMLAHELRNPLGPIRNAIHLLQTIDPSMDPRVQQLRDIIGRQVTHMARLIDDLLDATRLARGQILLRKEEFCDMGNIVRQTAEDYYSSFAASGVGLEVFTPPEPVWVEGDATRLVQAVGNLLHNAHKFTAMGGTVTVSLKQTGKSALIQVTDTGIGIDPLILPHVFDVFRQAEQGLDRNKGGLGLGLALVKGLIELHNGHVTATSEGPNKGSTFTIRLPLQQETPEKVPGPDMAACQQKARSRILIIEDNPDTAESTRIFLSLEGHDVRIAHTGSDGVITARAFRPEIIICDIGLPGMDGYQVARQIRQDTSLSSTYIIALTGYGREKDQHEAREAGFDLHLTKPIDFNFLRKAITRIPDDAKSWDRPELKASQS